MKIPGKIIALHTNVEVQYLLRPKPRFRYIVESPLWEGVIVVVWVSGVSASEIGSVGRVFVLPSCAGLSNTGW